MAPLLWRLLPVLSRPSDDTFLFTASMDAHPYWIKFCPINNYCILHERVRIIAQGRQVRSGLSLLSNSVPCDACILDLDDSAVGICSIPSLAPNFRKYQQQPGNGASLSWVSYRARNPAGLSNDSLLLWRCVSGAQGHDPAGTQDRLRDGCKDAGPQ